MAGAVGAQPAIRLRNVSKTFAGAQHVQALGAVGFEVPQGQFTSVLGPSGCGKSTLLRVIAGLIAPDAGATVEVMAHSQNAPSDDVGVVFQTHNLLPWLTVEKNIRLAAEVRRLPADEITRRVESILPVLRLQSFRGHYPHQLSGGMRQRAAVARVLANNPAVLLMDEPFAAVDAMTRQRLQEELTAITASERTTVLFVTHAIEEAVFLSNRVVALSGRPGRIIADIRIDLPRPRRWEDLVRDQRFIAYRDELTQCIHGDAPPARKEHV